VTTAPDQPVAQPDLQEDLETRRRRLRFRSWHRGTRESDLLLGRFADAHLAGFSAEEVALYDALLEENDPDIYNWLTDREPVPADIDTSVWQQLHAYYAQGYQG
jgi:antitoxin CptB